jgi:CDP-paratose 2-epimerase
LQIGGIKLKLLITGGCGFLGSNLAAYAIKQKWDVFIVDNLSRKGSGENLEWLNSLGEFHFYEGDTSIQKDIDYCINTFKPEAIFHLAGQVAMTTSISNPKLDFETNALGTLNLLEAVRNFVPKSPVVYSSTNKVYGDLEQYSYLEDITRFKCTQYSGGFDEEVPLEFHSPYGCSKGSADQYMLDYARIYGLNTVVFRHSSMYGGRQFSTADQGWVGWFCQKALETVKDPNVEFTISGNGKQVRDVLHADDMIELYYSALKYIDDIRGQAFNIGGGIENSLSLLELFSLLQDNLQVKLNVQQLPPRESDQRVFVADYSKFNKITGWTPKVSKEDGIKRMIEWERK